MIPLLILNSRSGMPFLYFQVWPRYSSKYWRQEDKGVTNCEMIGWHHQLNGHEFEQAPTDSEGQEAWRATVHGVTKLDKTEWPNNKKNNSSKTNSLVTSSIKHLRQIADHTLVLCLFIDFHPSTYYIQASIYRFLSNTSKHVHFIILICLHVFVNETVNSLKKA